MGSNRRRRRRRGGNRGQQDTSQQSQEQSPQPERASQRQGAAGGRTQQGAAGRTQRQQRSGRARWRGIRATIDSFGGLLTIGAVVVAVGAVIVLIILNRPGGDDAVGAGDFVAPAAQAPVAGRLLGNADAPVRIVAFEDFSCSHCGDFTSETKPLIEEEYINTGLVSIEFRHMAILGPDSERAAAASECAADQNLFWPYHDILFLRQGTPGWASEGNLKNFAREVNEALDGDGLDLDAFDGCIEAGVKELTVRAATDEAGQLIVGVGGRPSTPTFFMNGVLAFQGAQPIEAFRAEIDRLLAAAGVGSE